MTVLFMGGEMGAFVPSASGAAEAASYYDSGFARCALAISGFPAVYAESFEWTAQTGDFYQHFALRQSGYYSTNDVVISWLNAAGSEVLRIIASAASVSSITYQMQYLNASAAWTNAGTGVSFGEEIETFDFYANKTTGAMSLYSSGTERVAVTGLSLGHISGIAQTRLYGSQLPSASFSQVIAADEPTIGWRLVTRHASGAGATADWTGTYTEIDEAIYSDADFINSSVADQIELFTNTGPALTGYTVRAVAVTARAKRGASGPANLRLLLRVSGANYDNGADLALGVGYGAYCAVWEQNPATTADWVNTAIDSIQFGVKSIT